MERNGKMVDVRCDKCERVMYQRRGDTLIVHGLSIDLKRSHNIKCSCGKGAAMFCVNREKIVLVKNQEKD